jgi:hypothetical protein
MTDGVKVRGAARLQATLKAAGRDVSDMRSASTRVAANVAQKARGRAPRRTGALARSTTGKGTKQGASLTATVVYAGVIHNGWPRHNIERQPYIAQTIASEQSSIVDQYASETDKILSRVKGA